MKKTISIISILLAILNVMFAQGPYEDSTFFRTNFENDWSFIEFDPPEGNIWQVGSPSKTILDSAYTVPYALMTDTLNQISEPIKHSFTLKARRPLSSIALPYWLLGFYQKHDFDSLNSGGYIEVSYNNGESWTNIVMDDTLENSVLNDIYTIDDTLINGEPALTGMLNGENWFRGDATCYFRCSWTSAALVYSVWLKFTYINLGSDNPHEGWLIDNLVFEISDFCEYWESVDDINTDNLVMISPNPVIDILYVSSDKPIFGKIELSIYDLTGKVVFYKTDLQNEESINIRNLSKGMYIYRIKWNQKFSTGKFIKE